MRTISVLVLLSSSVAFAADNPSSDLDVARSDDPIDAPVVGGSPVRSGAYPDAVAVLAPNALCSGTLIAPDVVLTAGHCIETKPNKVVIGSVDLSKPAGELLAVKSAIAYPDWQHAYDVGVLVLESPSRVKPRAIAQACTAKDDLATNKRVRVVGFGLTSATGRGTNMLLEDAELPIDDPTCATDPACRPSPINPGGEFAAGGHGVDSCFGDSGGSLLAPTKHGEVLIGVVSRGVGTAGMPCGQGGINVRADKVVSWIEKETKRKLARATCDGSGDGSNQNDDPDDMASSGCSARTGAFGSWLLVIAAALTLALPRRREARLRS